MRQMPDSWVFEPWLHPQAASLGVPMPLVDLTSATRLAKQRVHQLRAQPDIKAAKAAIVQRHGSRKVSTSRKSTRSNAPSTQQQLDLGFEP
jgi:deoxyribodipyrimidine photo-lyase